jgi:hypothetical protein
MIAMALRALLILAVFVAALWGFGYLFWMAGAIR